jgi:hypothetical protein
MLLVSRGLAVATRGSLWRRRSWNSVSSRSIPHWRGRREAATSKSTLGVPFSTSSSDSPPETTTQPPLVNNNGSSTTSTNSIVDAHPLGAASSKMMTTKTKKKKIFARLPMVHSLVEFPPDRTQNLRRQQATVRILKIAADRLIEPPTLHLLAVTAWATMGIASLEGILLCQEWPWWDSWDAGKFVWWYSVEQLIPSIVWDSQSATLVARSLDLDPSVVLRDLSGDDAASATALLRIHLLSTTRYFVAGFMMIASIVRAAGVSAGAFSQYEERIRLGREPPLRLLEQESQSGVVIRMCGRDSYTTEVSLQKMGVHIFPVFEMPDRVQYLVWRHSEQLHRPVYWCVREGKYGSSYSWDRFPADPSIFFPPATSLTSRNNEPDPTKPTTKLLILEADATNPHDPLALGNTALDLNLDDASQGFRRIQERFSLAHPPTLGNTKPFRTLRVYLGNSLEIARTGGGHAYTLRHRVRYAKEVDVLIDSRAPVLVQILDWCRRVAGQDRRIFFQTSSPEYFRSLQKILQRYGYEIYDPLDLRTLWLSQTEMTTNHRGTKTKQSCQDEMSATSSSLDTTNDDVPPSLLGILMEDPLLYEMWRERGVKDILDSFSSPSLKLVTPPPSSTGTEAPTEQQQQQHRQNETHDRTNSSDMLRQVTKMAKLPRLVHMPTTAETVNAVEALITAGEVDAANCCAILERQEGIGALEYILDKKSDLVRGERHQEWIQDTITTEEGEPTLESRISSSETNSSSRWLESRRHLAGGGAGLQMICTSTIYDDLFRQVRMWARMGFTSTQIQKEIDFQFHEILDYSHEAQQQQQEEEGNEDVTTNITNSMENEMEDVPLEARTNTKSMNDDRIVSKEDPHS